MQTIVEVALSKAGYGESEILAGYRKDLTKELALRGMNCGVRGEYFSERWQRATRSQKDRGADDMILAATQFIQDIADGSQSEVFRGSKTIADESLCFREREIFGEVIGLVHSGSSGRGDYDAAPAEHFNHVVVV